MNKSATDTQRSEGKLKLAIRRMLDNYPFHVAILERFVLTCRPVVGTMAVTICDDDILLMFNPDFVLDTPLDEMVGVLLHEVHHILFRHPLADPNDYPDQWAHTVAEEITANESIRERLPSDAVRLERFPNLPPLESTDERYARLVDVVRRPQLLKPHDELDGFGGGDGGCGTGSKKEDGHDEVDGGCDYVERHDVGSSEDEQGDDGGDRVRHHGNGGADQRGDCARGGGDAGGKAADHVDQHQEHTTPDEAGRLLDDHGVWLEAIEDPVRSEATIEAVVHEATLEVGGDAVPPDLRELFGHLKFGDTPSEDQRAVRGDRQGQLNWRKLLRRYVGEFLDIRPVFNRPPRRFPELVGIMPGRRHQTGKPRVLAVVDTSGSITPDLLETINAELVRLARRYTVTVAECDADIQDVYAYRPLVCVTGGGGTDFRPPLARDFLRRHRPDLIVLFTDGFGPAPEKPPRVPVIWCLVPDGQAPVTWGRIVQIAHTESREETPE